MSHMTGNIETTRNAASSGVLRRRLFHAGPVAGFVGLSALLGWGLTRDPRELPSNLIGRPVPEFRLPPVQGRALGLASADLRGEVRWSISSPPGAWPAAPSIRS